MIRKFECLFLSENGHYFLSKIAVISQKFYGCQLREICIDLLNIYTKNNSNFAVFPLCIELTIFDTTNCRSEAEEDLRAGTTTGTGDGRRRGRGDIKRRGRGRGSTSERRREDGMEEEEESGKVIYLKYSKKCKSKSCDFVWSSTYASIIDDAVFVKKNF